MFALTWCCSYVISKKTNDYAHEAQMRRRRRKAKVKVKVALREGTEAKPKNTGSSWMQRRFQSTSKRWSRSRARSKQIQGLTEPIWLTSCSKAMAKVVTKWLPPSQNSRCTERLGTESMEGTNEREHLGKCFCGRCSMDKKMLWRMPFQKDMCKSGTKMVPSFVAFDKQLQELKKLHKRCKSCMLARFTWKRMSLAQCERHSAICLGNLAWRTSNWKKLPAVLSIKKALSRQVWQKPWKRCCLKRSKPKRGFWQHVWNFLGSAQMKVTKGLSRELSWRSRIGSTRTTQCWHGRTVVVAAVHN